MLSRLLSSLGLLNPFRLVEVGAMAIDPGTAILLAGGANLLGGLIGGNSAKKAQEAANRTNAAIAAQQSKDAWNNWLVSRGVSSGGPGLPYAGGPVNTSLPLWSTIGDVPTEKFLMDAIFRAGGFGNSVYGPPEAPLNLAGANTLGDESSAYQALTKAYIQAGSPGAGGAMAHTNSWNDAFNAWTSKLSRISGIDGWSGIRAPLLTMGQSEIDKLDAIAQQGGPEAVQAYINDQASKRGGADNIEGVESLSPDRLSSARPKRGGADNIEGVEGGTFGVPPEYLGLQAAAVGSANKIFNGGFLAEEMAALNPALVARRAAADLGFERNNELRSRIQDIYGAEIGSSDGIYDAATSAAKLLFDARMTSADAFGTGAREASDRMIARSDARRGLQGFSGGSSFDDLNRSRILAEALTQGALARGAAGEGNAKMLGDAGVARASSRGAAGVGRATRLGAVLDSDVKVDQQNADLQNALDRLQLVTGDIGRRTSSFGLPGQLMQQDTNMRTMASENRFRDLDAVLRRMGMFASGNATPPTPVQAPVQPSITTGQIVGGALSGLGQMGMDYWSTQSLVNALSRQGGNMSLPANLGAPKIQAPSMSLGPRF